MTKSTTRVAADLETFTQTEITAKDVVAKAGRKNLIINGDMKIAQRGTSFTSYSGYTIDRYKGFGHTYNRIDNGDFYSLRMLWVTGTDANIYYPVELERGQLENGQTYTLSFKYKSSGSPMTLEIFYRTGTTGANVISQISGQTLPDSSGFSEYSITFTCNGRIAAHTALNIRFGNASGTNEIANLQLELGSVATDFEQRSYGEELALCQRYYWKTSTGGSYNYITVVSCSSATAAHGAIQFPTTMRAAPTGSLSGNWQLAGAGAVSVVTSAFTNVSASHTRITLSTANGLVTNAAFGLRNYGDTSAYLAFDAEL